MGNGCTIISNNNKIRPPLNAMYGTESIIPINNNEQRKVLPVNVINAIKVKTFVIVLPKQIYDVNKFQNNYNCLITMHDREIIARCWRQYIINKKTDIFHKTMLRCIEASPKLNEIIACGRYCYRDLRKWPKLNKICQAQFKFYERLIYELNMDEQKMLDSCIKLGERHAEYERFGMKPHFLDIYQQQFLGLIACIEFETSNERKQTVIAFSRLCSFIINAFINAYALKRSELKEKEKAVKFNRNFCLFHLYLYKEIKHYFFFLLLFSIKIFINTFVFEKGCFLRNLIFNI
ncbi:hypothetical protein Mgra_00002698 [Meloidogyne graminicola]|uniref:GLOBIN domain-containing protein n=1 Tax=Meloidogyne graminicola TaxID=189291 RepID=A0A8S9ZVI5_9BILA|nr:hypothetical protein Mgra_00002698 [Meloidogyne graminicola]